MKKLAYILCILILSPVKNLNAGDLKGAYLSYSNETLVAIHGVTVPFLSKESESTMNQKNMRFIPRMLPVMIGKSVIFPNSEEIIYHNVYSESGTNQFDLGTYRAGKIKAVEFKEAGIVEVMCKIHTRMYAAIIVLENPFYSLVDTNGQFSIKNIPKGNYEVVVYTLGDFEIISEGYQISVPEDGVVELTIE